MIAALPFCRLTFLMIEIREHQLFQTCGEHAQMLSRSQNRYYGGRQAESSVQSLDDPWTVWSHHRHVVKLVRSITRVGLIWTLLGGSGTVSVIAYCAQHPFFFAMTEYFRVKIPTLRVSLRALKCRDQPRICLMRQCSQRIWGMTKSLSPVLDRYASSISWLVGSPCG